jgi:hypothetical protein
MKRKLQRFTVYRGNKPSTDARHIVQYMMSYIVTVMIEPV